MIRLSFRQTMLVGFLIIFLFLGWTGVQGWFLMERFAAQSRADSEQFLQLSASIQELAERVTELERSARQFQVLSDQASLERFDMHVARSLVTVDQLESLSLSALTPLIADWRKAVDELARGLLFATPSDELQRLLWQLGEINNRLEAEGERWIDSQHEKTLDELEQGQLRLGQLTMAAVFCALSVALIMGWWLSRPVNTIKQAIKRLGENHFDDPIMVFGPADLRQVGYSLDWLRQRLNELETDRERTLRHVSHELKTPLTALREGIALLQEEIAGPLGGTQREVVDILQDNALALQNHIENLLKLNAIALDNRRLHRRPTNLKRLLREVIQERELQLQARRLCVECHAPSTVVLIDVEKLRVVVDNLLSNAIDFSPEKGSIRFDASLSGNQLKISCHDEGPGVAAEDAKRIFEPFVQGKRLPSLPRRGSGVGLSIVRELVAVMGGKISLVTSENTLGAHFEIELPCKTYDDLNTH